MEDLNNNIGDVVSLTVVLGTISQVLPPIAALLAIIWTAIRIYDRLVHGVSK